MTTQTNVNDFIAGQKDRKSGYYDKWYRYNREDDGAAYDSGSNSTFCKKKEGIVIIECLHN